MNSLAQTTTTEWINSVGWTLLHSLWQAAIVYILVTVALRMIPQLRSAVRYAISYAGLVLIGITSVATFIQHSSSEVNSAALDTLPMLHQAVYFTEVPAEEHTLLNSMLLLIEQNMPLIVAIWAIGFLVFAVRWVFGLIHTNRIRSGAQLMDGEWHAYVQRTARALAISRPVRIAESLSINAPMVLGYFKPIILIPVGMVAGLSTQQLETVFMHELAHIRRGDYLMNVFQTVVESIFFFNPFVRMLSNEVRREREYCCDDMVVSMHGNNAAYAHALFALAEARLAAPVLALPLTGDKNQLLARIKRIMERSAKIPSVKSRLLVPLLLLTGALASLSWISSERDAEENVEAVLPDRVTGPEMNWKTARFSRRSIITFDEHGQPHEEVIQEFEGDEELRALLESNIATFHDSAFANRFHRLFPDQMDGKMMPLWGDTIPQQKWQEFAEGFNESVRENLQNLFGKDSDPRKFLEDFENNFGWESWAIPFENFPLDSLGKLRHDDVFKNFREELEKFREFAPGHLDDLKGNLRPFDNPIQRYDRALREQLIEDGYLSANENIESLQWSDESFKVNGKDLKPEDVKRYNDLRESILEGDASK